eukprot:TRINITY_DN62885_c0_g1_i1.p1 TRINITY_DN62885_c0_g1~~TRINITY_DN62885_c0_g1_i1.p1  ORF type:complete len:837 (+),score=170.91 TRINITY_DN62885_c0_g1_i1:366-2513(+)
MEEENNLLKAQIEAIKSGRAMPRRGDQNQNGPVAGGGGGGGGPVSPGSSNFEGRRREIVEEEDDDGDLDDLAAESGVSPEVLKKLIAKATRKYKLQIEALEKQLSEAGKKPPPAGSTPTSPSTGGKKKSARSGDSDEPVSPPPGLCPTCGRGGPRGGHGGGGGGGSKATGDVSDGDANDDVVPPELAGLSSDDRAKEAIRSLNRANRLLSKQSMLIFRALKRYTDSLKVKATPNGQTSVEKLLGNDGEGDTSQHELFQDALAGYDRWANDVGDAVDNIGTGASGVQPSGAAVDSDTDFRRPGRRNVSPVTGGGSGDVGGEVNVVGADDGADTGGHTRPAPRRPKVVQGDAGTGGVADDDFSEIVSPGTGGDDKENEVKLLKNKVKAQQDEISKLLLTIDELRARIGKIRASAGDHGGEVATKITGIMERVGLREMMEVGSVPKLKGVFERLYQDAVQRIQRIGLIRERMILASQAYDVVVDAMTSNSPPQDPLQAADGSTDLQRLNDTASAVLQGMWYHTDYLFRHACDYATAQGVEASVQKGGRSTLNDLMDSVEDEEVPLSSSPNPEAMSRSRRRGDRLPGRRGERPRMCASASESGKAFWHQPEPGGLSNPMTPRQMRKLNVQDPGNTSFTSYVAALREARGDLRHDDWPNCPRQVPEKRCRGSDKLDVILNLPGKASRGLAPSQSLPALSKGRSVMQQAAEADASFDPRQM